MNPRMLKLGGVLFLIAGLAFLASAYRSGRGTAIVFGCTFITLGAALIARSRRGASA